MEAGLSIGCSGWDYAEWVGRFYPKGTKDRLAHYATIFPIVEIDTSFYRIPPVAHVQSWARRTPERFRFTAKMPQEVTHVRRLVDAGEAIDEFYRSMEPLVAAGKLSAVLVQLPPSLAFHAPTVRAFYERLPRRVPVAVEFREPSWRAEASWALLEEFGFAATVVDEPKLPIDLRVTAPFSYVRWHGHGTSLWYDYTFSPEELAAWIPRLAELGAKAPSVLAFFNNHFRGDAPMNAGQLRDLLGLPMPSWTRRL